MTEKNRIEFVLEQIIHDDDHARLGGRCLLGNINIGDIFTLTYKSIYDYSNDQASETRVGEKSVYLTVSQIFSFRNPISELSEGMSGEIIISGEGLMYLQEQNLLCSMK